MGCCGVPSGQTYSGTHPAGLRVRNHPEPRYNGVYQKCAQLCNGRARFQKAKGPANVGPELHLFFYDEGEGGCAGWSFDHRAAENKHGGRDLCAGGWIHNGDACCKPGGYKTPEGKTEGEIRLRVGLDSKAHSEGGGAGIPEPDEIWTQSLCIDWLLTPQQFDAAMLEAFPDYDPARGGGGTRPDQCPQCGNTDISEHANFCDRCGYSFFGAGGGSGSGPESADVS